MARNPYLNRSMIRAVDQFFGRQREVERIMSRLGSDPPQSISIVGARRAGKSSLLWHIAQAEIHARYLDAPGRYVFLLFDFQGQQHLDQSGFWVLHNFATKALTANDLRDLGVMSANLCGLARGLRYNNIVVARTLLLLRRRAA